MKGVIAIAGERDCEMGVRIRIRWLKAFDLLGVPWLVAGVRVSPKEMAEDG